MKMEPKPDTEGRMEQEKRALILELPREMIQEIACHLSSDADLCRMIRTCSYFARTIMPSGSGVWRARFLNFYDHPPPVSSFEVEYEYKFRSIIFAYPVSFKKGEGIRESLWLSCITTMLKESYNPPPRPNELVNFSRNLSFIDEQTQKSDFFTQPFISCSLPTSFSPTPRFLATQLTLTYFVLQLEKTTREVPADYDIGEVYDRRELVSRGTVDLHHASHIRNFWRRHLTLPLDHSYYQSYELLGIDRRPSLWKTKIASLKPLGNHWLGYYSCLHPFEPSFRQTCADGESHWATVPVLVLRIANSTDTKIWPDLFNTCYPKDDEIDKSHRSYFHGVQSLHNTPFPSQYTLRGFTEECPEQEGIPGWRRICFVIFRSCDPPPPISEDDIDGVQKWQPKNWELDFHWAYGYQGIVTPGGKIMLGGWLDLLHPMETSSSGPFIFWEV